MSIASVHKAPFGATSGNPGFPMLSFLTNRLFTNHLLIEHTSDVKPDSADAGDSQGQNTGGFLNTRQTQACGWVDGRSSRSQQVQRALHERNCVSNHKKNVV